MSDADGSANGLRFVREQGKDLAPILDAPPLIDSLKDDVFLDSHGHPLSTSIAQAQDGNPARCQVHTLAANARILASGR